MTYQHASEVAADDVHQAIDLTANAISKSFDLDVQRVRSVLKATEYKGRITHPVSKSHNSLTRLWRSVWQQNHPSELRDSHIHIFSPSLAHALEYLPPAEALNFFENENISLLKSRESAMHYLFERFTPLHDLEELRKLAKSLRSHLKRNRDYILETGLPKRTFKKSQLLNSLLSPIYPDKNACSLSSDKSHKLNLHERLTIFNLKLKILKELIIFLKNKNIQLLIENCTKILSFMSSEEFHRFIEFEKICFSQPTPKKRKLEYNFHLSTGGIIDILKTIGYYEKEFTIGTYSKTKDMLADIISNSDFTRLRKDNNTNVSPYFRYVALGKKEALDKALDQFLSLHAKEEIFWKQYPHRVQELLGGLIERFLRSEFYAAVDKSGTKARYCLKYDRKSEGFKRVVFETMVETGFADLLEQNLHHFTELFKWHIANTGKPPEPPQPHSMVMPTKLENVFHKEGEIWRITFKGESISLKDTKGLRYIACLLSIPEKEFYVFDLIAEVEGIPSGAANETYSKMSSEELEKKHNLTSSFPEDAGDEIDLQTKNDIQERLRELREDLAEAERNNDLGLMTNYKEEIEYLKSYISQGYSTKKGKSRKAADPADKARKSVTMSIRRSLDKIQHDHPSLGRHLDNAIQRGLYCSYSPDAPIEWSL